MDLGVGDRVVDGGEMYLWVIGVVDDVLDGKGREVRVGGGGIGECDGERRVFIGVERNGG